MEQLYRIVLEVAGVLTLDTDNLSLSQAQERREELLLSHHAKFIQIVPIDENNQNMFAEEQSE